MIAIIGMDAPEFVIDFHKLSSEVSENSFLKEYQNSDDPSVLAYVIAVKMKQVEYYANPLTKLRVFNAAKKELNNLINENPDNVHLRYMRLVIQEKTPKILGYINFIEEDKNFIRGKLAIKDSSDYLDKFIKQNTSI